jgi:hypothetical protein
MGRDLRLGLRTGHQARGRGEWILDGSLRLFRKNVPLIPACLRPRTAKGGRKASLRAAKGGQSLLGGPDLARPRPEAFRLPDKRTTRERDRA